jgi:fatty acid desaturase
LRGRRRFLHIDLRRRSTRRAMEMTMIYIFAALLPPLGLLLNGQLFAAIFNAVIFLPCMLLGLIFPPLFFVPSAHAVIAVYMSREDRKHREIVDAIERHGPPPSWRGAGRAIDPTRN